MKKALKTAMMVSISEVFETMFFLTLEENEQLTLKGSDLLNPDTTITTRIDFKGSFSGYFIFFIPEKLLTYLAICFMGLEEEELTDEHTHGTIKEALNMLAGSALSSYDEKIEFHLTIPEILDINKAIELEKGSDEEEIVVVMETNEGYLALKSVFKNT